MTDENRRSRGGSNPYRTISASERRARRRARGGDSPATMQSERRDEVTVPQDVVNELLMNPTKVVTEEQLRSEYGYVLADIRGMFILAAGLVVLLVAMALILPQL